MLFKLKHLSVLVPFALLASACDDKSAQIGCSHESAKTTLFELLNKEAYNLLSQEVDEFKEITSQNKRSALSSIALGMSEITTTSKDSNSTMKTCEATVSMTIPAENYNNLAQLYKEMTDHNLDRVLEDHSLQQNANSFSKRIEYTVQPTDDAKTVFVKTLESDIPAAMSEVAAISVLKPVFEQKKREQAEQKLKQEMEAKQAEQKLKQEMEAKQAEERRKEQQLLEKQRQIEATEAAQKAQSATTSLPTTSSISLSDARSRYLASDTELNQVWSMLSKEQKQALLPAQRQWIKSKDAICGKTSMKGSESALIDMFRCQQEMTQSRIAELR